MSDIAEFIFIWMLFMLVYAIGYWRGTKHKVRRIGR